MLCRGKRGSRGERGNSLLGKDRTLEVCRT
jgi:hypothetical protein